MCLHCVSLLSELEYDLWFLSDYSQSYLDFLFTVGFPVGRICIQSSMSVRPQ